MEMPYHVVLQNGGWNIFGFLAKPEQILKFDGEGFQVTEIERGSSICTSSGPGVCAPLRLIPLCVPFISYTIRLIIVITDNHVHYLIWLSWQHS